MCYTRMLVVILCMITSSRLCLGEETKNIPSPFRDEGQVITPLKKGYVAPFSGVLFSPSAAASVATEIDSFKERLRIEREAAVSETIAKKDFEIAEITSQSKSEKKILETLLDSERATNKEMQSVLQKNQNNWIFWIAGGALGGTLISILSVYATQKFF